MNKFLKQCMATLVASTLLITGCSTQAPVNNASNTEVTASSVTPKADVFVQKAVTVTVEKASLYGDKVEVASSFAQFTAKTMELERGSKDTLAINSLSPQLLSLNAEGDKTKTPIALSVVANPQRAQTVLISPQTTAEALIFMNPAVATVDLPMAEKTMKIIKALPETKELANVIETRTQQDKNFLYKDNDKQNKALDKAVNAVINKIADEFEKSVKEDDSNNRVQGVEINVVEQQELTAKFQIKNHRKRMVTLNFMGSGRPVYSETVTAAYDLIDLDNLSLGFRPNVKEGNYDIQRPMDQVELIGMGLKDFKEFKEKWDGMPQAEKMKFGVPMAQGIMSDFVSPVISVVMGFNVNKVYHVGLMKILSGLPILEIISDFKNKQFGKAFKAVLTGTIKQLLYHNGALLREILLKAGVQLTEAMIARLTAVVGIFNLVRYAVEAARALYAYSTSKITDHFKVEKLNGKLQFLRSDAKK